uniref:SF3 helicase domain-containing protein n=1 Tax=viral metagenome TaxID=1070528 RepID=A0A6C0DZ83_9ZZZZ
MQLNIYKKKIDVLNSKVEGDVVAALGYDKYFTVKSHAELMQKIKEDSNKCFFEHVGKNSYITMYFDLDISKDKQPEHYENYSELISQLKECVVSNFKDSVLKWIILQSHCAEKRSFHIIVRISDINGNNIYFRNCNELKQYVTANILCNSKLSEIVDLSVYRDGLFRTLYSSKPKETRPFVKSSMSDDFDDVESFVTFTQEPYTFYSASLIKPKVHGRLEIAQEMLEKIDISKTYDEWMHIGFSLIDYCREYDIDLEVGLELFDNYSKRNIDKYDKRNTAKQWNDWTTRDYDGPKITRGTLLKKFKQKEPERYNEMNLAATIDTDILKELDVISNNSSVKIHDIKHFEIVNKNKASIQALMESKGLHPIHDYVSKNCKNASLYSECDRNGYKICCRNCDFEYPPGNIPVDRSLAPTVFNLLIINKDDNINNKDTSQVAQKIITYKNLIYTIDNKWYLYNDTSGIYENKIDLEIMNEMERVVQTMSDEGFEEEWFNWIHKVNYKENLLKEMKIKCFKRVELDDDDYLLGFEEGVLDLRTCEFRRGAAYEYVTMKCGVPYEDDVDTSLADEVLSGIFPDEEERNYALCKFALCLEGYNREQMITFCYSHTASNGKSYIMERLRQALGDYSGTFPVTMLTGKMKGAGEANSSLVDFNKKRFMYCSEPEAGSKLNTNFVKLLTGDRIKARGLYSEKDIEISPTYNIYICCNTLPNFDVYDEGIARRIRLIEYKTRFCDNPKKKNDRKLKKYSKEEELEIAKGLLKLLVDKYKVLRRNNYKYNEPKSFLSMRKLYLNDNKDVLTDILQEHFERGGDKDYVKMSEIKTALKAGGIKEKDVITIQKIVEETFEDVEYIIDSSINSERVRRAFIGLKYK